MPEGVLAEFTVDELFAKFYAYVAEVEGHGMCEYEVVGYCQRRFKEDYPDE